MKSSDCLRYTTPAAARNGRFSRGEGMNRVQGFDHGIICYRVNQTHGPGGIGADRFPGHKYLQSNAYADQSRQPLRSSPACY